MVFKKIRSNRKSIILAVLFILLYLSFVSIHNIAENNLEFVPESLFRETNNVAMEQFLQSGVYYLVLDVSGLHGSIGPLIPFNFGLTSIKGQISSSNPAQTLMILNEFLSFNEILEIRFIVPSPQDITISFKSNNKISGAIYETVELSTLNGSKSISNIRLIPYFGMVAILILAIYQFVKRLKNVNNNIKDTIIVNSDRINPKEGNVNESTNTKALTTQDKVFTTEIEETKNLSRRERKIIEKKEKEEAKLNVVKEAEILKKQELDNQMKVRIEKFRKIVLRSDKLRLEQLASMLRMGQADLLDWLYELPDEFGFVINQDIVEFDTVKIGDSIDKLLAGFDEIDKTKMENYKIL